MLDNARKAMAHAVRGGADWHHDELVVDAVANRVRQVAQLARYGFPDEKRADFPRIPWDDLARARDFFTHHYARLDPVRLRGTVETSLREVMEELDRPGIPDFAD